jgi:hypothetical protein
MALSNIRPEMILLTFLAGVVVIIVPIVILRWVFRVNEIVAHQKKTIDLLEQIAWKIGSSHDSHREPPSPGNPKVKVMGE